MFGCTRSRLLPLSLLSSMLAAGCQGGGPPQTAEGSSARAEMEPYGADRVDGESLDAIGTDSTAGEPDRPPSLPEPSPEGRPTEEVDRFASPDGAISVARPPASRFECVEQHAELPLSTTLLKCRRTDAGAFFFMMAKTYEVPRDDIKSAKVLVEEVFPSTYRQLFDEYTVDESGPRSWRGVEGFEASIRATHGKLGAISKRELVLTEGTRVFILSAEGSPAAFEAEEEVIARWMETARFAALRLDP